MNLKEFFSEHPKAALAFSGGVDSAYLLYAGIQSGCDIHAYYVKSPFQPEFELKDALRLAEQLEAKITVLDVNVLEDPVIVQNPADRCYHCKKHIFSAILEAAKKDGYALLIDGTNFSDDVSDRPGFRALQELSVASPLRLCELSKEQIRSLSQKAGLFTWDKPAYACLATRIPSGTPITQKKLAVTEQAEEILASMGFSDFRIRYSKDDAKIQLPASQMEQFWQKREEILAQLKPFYHSVTLDLEGRS